MKFNFSFGKSSSDSDQSENKKRSKKFDLKQINVRAVGAVLSFVIAIFLLGYRGYLKRQANRLEQVVKEKEQMIVTKKQELNRLVRNDSYQRFQATKTLVKESKGRDWKASITYLINLYNVLQSLDDDKSGVVLEDFTVEAGSVNFRGHVDQIETIYQEDGVLDKLIALRFIDTLDIPFYKKSGEGYSFILEAKIKRHDRLE